MLSRTKRLSNFSNSIQTQADCLRPDNETQITQAFDSSSKLLARGNGLSYSDCCVNHEGTIVEMTRLNHLISFDEATGVLITQGGVTFADLLTINPHYIPPVIPGTLKATVAGGVANDIHGKNNHRAGSFGQHLAWIELQLGNQSFLCNPQKNRELFYATIGGLGLTGIIKRVAINMKKASHFVSAETEKHTGLETLLQRMLTHAINYDYQMAWLDLMNTEHNAVLSMANYTENENSAVRRHFTIPKLPLRLLNAWNIRLFNRFYFSTCRPSKKILPLADFNNPLDTFEHWNRLYGKNGLIQFQAVFDAETALSTIQHLHTLIKNAQATPTLAVLKYFSQPGCGLLSFVQPGFTLAIDFINNQQAQQAYRAMNEYITDIRGKNYLAKDLFLTAEQFRRQYSHYEHFIDLLAHYKSSMCSDLSKRLGITS